MHLNTWITSLYEVLIFSATITGLKIYSFSVSGIKKSLFSIFLFRFVKSHFVQLTPRLSYRVFSGQSALKSYYMHPPHESQVYKVQIFFCINHYRSQKYSFNTTCIKKSLFGGFNRFFNIKVHIFSSIYYRSQKYSFLSTKGIKKSLFEYCFRLVEYHSVQLTSRLSLTLSPPVI